MPIRAVSNVFDPVQTAGLVTAVVADARMAVWHVALARPQYGFVGGGLTGAWEFDLDDPRLPDLFTSRLVVADTAGSVTGPHGSVQALGLDDLAECIAACQHQLQQAFEAHLDSLPPVKRNLVPINWPTASTVASVGSELEEPVCTVLRTAHRAARLVRAWNDTETLRLARGYLVPFGGPVAQALPSGWAT